MRIAALPLSYRPQMPVSPGCHALVSAAFAYGGQLGTGVDSPCRPDVQRVSRI